MEVVDQSLGSRQVVLSRLCASINIIVEKEDPFTQLELMSFERAAQKSKNKKHVKMCCCEDRLREADIYVKMRRC